VVFHRGAHDHQGISGTLLIGYPLKDEPAGRRRTAEETGEVSEAIHNFLGQHLQKQLDEVKLEIADYISCIFGVANSASIDVASDLEEMFKNGCHVCHKVPCVCTFSKVVALKS
jgi:NTP pyrophosphatase (non-canonical NTP hydrolase)